MTTPKSNFKWNCATPCFVSKIKHPATSIHASDEIGGRRSTGLRDADYSAAFKTMEVRRCFGKINEAHSQVNNTRRTFPTTWVYPDYKGCSETAASPGLFTLPIAWDSDTIDSGIQRQGNRRNLSTRDKSPKNPSFREKAMFEAICRLYMSPKKKHPSTSRSRYLRLRRSVRFLRPSKLRYSARQTKAHARLA